MAKLNGLFGLGNAVFWGLLGLLVLVSLIQFFDREFNNQLIKERFSRMDSLERGLIVLVDLDTIKEDTIKKPKKEKEKKKEKIMDAELHIWNWIDPYRFGLATLEFRLKKTDYEKSVSNRNKLLFEDVEQVYRALLENDRSSFDNMIEAYKQVSVAKNLDYLQTLEFVVGSIQTIPYTFVTMGNIVRCPCRLSFGKFYDDCSVRPDGRGCCNDIEPFAVFSPTEFADTKKGDCDTRTLFAYTILSGMNFDVTILNSVAAGHSILGVYSPKPLGNGVYVLGKNGKKYYTWELTAVMPPGIYPYNVSLYTWYSVLK